MEKVISYPKQDWDRDGCYGQISALVAIKFAVKVGKQFWERLCLVVESQLM